MGLVYGYYRDSWGHRAKMQLDTGYYRASTGGLQSGEVTAIIQLVMGYYRDTHVNH